MMKNSKNLIVIIGPTAVGKTDLCVSIAKELATEIISADSRQFYEEMNIGTAKPTDKEMGEVVHHLIDNLSIENQYDVGQYEKDALTIIERLFNKHEHAILTGGSGLYIDAVCTGIDEMPDIPKDLRKKLYDEYDKSGLEPLLEKLKTLDNNYYHKVDQNNPQRIIRALEVCMASGKPYSSFRQRKVKQRPFNIVKIGLERDRGELYERIDSRMDKMIEQGLFEEAKSLYSFKTKNALQTVGYKEIFDFMDGKYDREEAVRLLKRNSRRYAKRQMTWFGKDDNIKWFHSGNVTEILDYIRGNST